MKENSCEPILFHYYDYAISLSEKVELTFEAEIPISHHSYSKKIAELILRFPERFLKCNLGIYFETRCPPDPILFTLLAERQNLVLNNLRVYNE